MAVDCGQRIVIVGSAGSGKTTLARQLSARLDLPHVELDRLYWQPDWTPTPHEEFCDLVRDAVAGERWILDGNYLKLREITWNRADTIVWLDYRLPVVWRRLGRRTLARLIKRQTLWNHNRKIWRTQFLSRNSFIRTYRKRRKEYPQLIMLPEYAHLTIVRLRSPRAAKNWFNKVCNIPHKPNPIMKRLRRPRSSSAGRGK